MHNFVKTLFSVLLLLFCSVLTAQDRMNDARDPNRIWRHSSYLVQSILNRKVVAKQKKGS